MNKWLSNSTQGRITTAHSYLPMCTPPYLIDVSLTHATLPPKVILIGLPVSAELTGVQNTDIAYINRQTDTDN